MQLAFCDLSENEALLIEIYRDWLDPRIDKDAVERDLRLLFRADILTGLFDLIFDTFRQLSPDVANLAGWGAYLTRQEQDLLQELSVVSDGLTGRPLIRSPHSIAMSQTDRLRMSINATYSGIFP